MNKQDLLKAIETLSNSGVLSKSEREKCIKRIDQVGLEDTFHDFVEVKFILYLRQLKYSDNTVLQYTRHIKNILSVAKERKWVDLKGENFSPMQTEEEYIRVHELIDGSNYTVQRGMVAVYKYFIQYTKSIYDFCNYKEYMGVVKSSNKLTTDFTYIPLDDMLRIGELLDPTTRLYVYMTYAITISGLEIVSLRKSDVDLIDKTYTSKEDPTRTVLLPDYCIDAFKEALEVAEDKAFFSNRRIANKRGSQRSEVNAYLFQNNKFEVPNTKYLQERLVKKLNDLFRSGKIEEKYKKINKVDLKRSRIMEMYTVEKASYRTIVTSLLMNEQSIYQTLQSVYIEKQ